MSAKESSIVVALFNKPNFKSSLQSICKELIAFLPTFDSSKEDENLKKLYQTLAVFWEFDHTLPLIIRPFAEITKNSPLNGLNMLINMLPDINLQSSDLPMSESGALTYLHGQSIQDAWKNIYFRISVRLLNEMIIHFYLQELLSANANINDSVQILSRIISYIITEEDAKYKVFHYITALKMSGSVHIITSAQPVFGFSFITTQGKLTKGPKILDYTIYFALYSQMALPISEFMKIDEKGLIKFFTSILKFLDSKHCTPEFTDIIPDFLTNFFGTLLANSKDMQNSKFVLEMYQNLTKRISSSNYYGKLIITHTMLQIFIDNPKFKMNYMTYFNTFLKKKLNNDAIGYVLIKSFTYFLRGKHYLPPIIIQKTHENYKWHIDDDSVMTHMFDTILANPTLFKNCQLELSEFLLQFISYNIPMFCVDHLPIIQDSKNFESLNTTALLLCLQQVLSVRSNFPYLGDARVEFASYGASLSLPFISEQEPQAIERHEIAVSTPIMGSLDYFHGDIDMLTLHIYNDAYPNVITTFIPKNLALLTKWASKYDIKGEIQMYSKYEDEIKFRSSCGDISTVSPALIQAITIFCSLGDKAPIENLSRCILSSDPYISVVSMRSCAVIAVNSEPQARNFIQILSRLFKIDSGFQQNLYRILYTLNEIVSVSYAMNYTFNDASIKELDVGVLYALSSPSSQVRNIATSIIGKVKNSAMFDLILNITDEISNLGWSHALIGLTFSNDRQSHEPIIPKFEDIIDSPYANVYGYYFASLIYLMKQHNTENKIDFQNIILSIIHSFERMNGSRKSLANPSYICNLATIVLTLSEKFDENCIYTVDFLATINGMSEFSLEALFSCLSIQTIYSIFDSSKTLMFANGICFGIHRYASMHNMTMIEKNIAINILTQLPQMLQNQEESPRFHSNLLLAASTIFKIYPENINNVFALYSTPTNNFEKHIRKDVWFKYLFKKNDKASMETLGWLMNFIPPPKSIYDEILDDIFSKEDAVVKAFLSTNFLLLLDVYIENAGDHQGRKFFKAITSLMIPYHNKNDFLNSMEEVFELAKNNVILQGVIHSIYQKSGSLFALAFLYLTTESYENDIKRKAFSLIANVVAIASHHLNKRPLLVRSLDFLESISNAFKTSLVALLSHAMKMMTNFLAEEFAFCGEQFVYWMFQFMMDFPYHTDLGNIVLPWINEIHFDIKKHHVFFNTALEFIVFSTVSFVDLLLQLPVSANLLGIIDRISHEKGKYPVSIVDFLVKYIIMEGQFNGGSISNCKNITSYLLSDQTDQVVPILKYIFSFQMWLYMHNLTAKANALDSVEEDEEEEKEKKNDEKEEEEDDLLEVQPKTYKAIENFCLSFLRMTYDVWNLSDELADVVLVFALINPLKMDCTVLIKSIIPKYTDIHSSNVSIYARDYIFSLSKERQIVIGQHFITWGLCCGDTEIATRALTWYGHMLLPQSRGIFDGLISAMQICSQVLYEVTNNVNKDWKLRTFFQDVQPETGKLIVYISECIKVLAGLVKNDSEPHPQLFFIAASFLNCSSSKEMADLVKSALTLMDILLNHPATVQALKKEAHPQSFKGLLNALTQTALSVEAVSILHTIFISIFKNNMTNLVYEGDNKKTFAISLLFFIPLSDFCGSTVHDDLGRLDDMVWPFELDAPKRTLAKCLSEQDISLVVTLLDKFLYVLPRNAASLVFRMCTELLETEQISASVFAPIANRASFDVEPEHAAVSLKFLTLISKSGVAIDLTQTKQVQKKNFPPIYFPEEFAITRNFVTQSKLMFEEALLFPVHPIYDASFILSETVNSIKEQWMKINVWPIYEWQETFKQAAVKFEPNFLNSIESIKELPAVLSTNKLDTLSPKLLEDRKSQDLSSASFMPTNIVF